MTRRHDSRQSPRAHEADRLGAAVRRFARRRRPAASPTVPAPPAPDFGARIADLERQVQEVRTRINALFFAVLTAALVDLGGRLVLG